MNVDPDGHWIWFAINAGFAVYDGYKAYKSGKGWKGEALAAASNFGPGKIFKVLKVVKRAKRSSNIAHNAARHSKLKEHYRQSQKYGNAKVRHLSGGRYRYYGHVKPANKKGEMGVEG